MPLLGAMARLGSAVKRLRGGAMATAAKKFAGKMGNKVGSKAMGGYSSAAVRTRQGVQRLAASPMGNKVGSKAMGAYSSAAGGARSAVGRVPGLAQKAASTRVGSAIGGAYSKAASSPGAQKIGKYVMRNKKKYMAGAALAGGAAAYKKGKSDR